MIVVDTNLIGYLYLESAETPMAERVLERDPKWVAPLLWRSELRNVLALYLRKKWLSLAHAQRIMADAQSLMHGREYDVDTREVLQLAASSPCSAFDCEFVYLAQALGVVLVTGDRQILKHFPNTAVSLRQFVSA